ncbi:hypothetical protein TVAG_149640 [Trichomonas vaginalis G3]|uniref:Uncharacterized protein n=1 Tax=Trichomonas vaginalis (strain ATCC PRA-98 / G3) TaxID=412133 RepID=A2ELN1_TRIV3|nr:hypothetical protein TVAGG3_0713120 [Trichomonas vaginalis G3]EAY06478.1 hypothetical protein TVAG_149640 [Trichomonas vaginalis G3]KAI5510061.1 hypothetical protein TVAGG3_0713120 [Trichomonas vaginalis G3]|eukprot:XP_001318701.1 hypothetical protein [Trichomonas vaginalis G3]
MNFIKEFLAQSNSSADVDFSFQPGKSIPSKCVIQFVFLVITHNKKTQLAFLPDYVPALQKGKLEKKSLMFTPAGTNVQSFTLTSVDDHLLILWLNFTVNAKPLLDEMIKIIDNQKIETKINALIVDKNNEKPVQCEIVLNHDLISYTPLNGGKITTSYQITKKSVFLLNKFEEDPYILVKECDNTSQFKIILPDIEFLKHWFLSLIAIRQITINNEKKALSNLKRSLQQTEVTAPKIPIKIEQPQPEIKKEPSIDTLKEAEQKKEAIMQKYKQEAEDLKQNLQQKLANYKRSFPKPKKEEEPELDAIDLSKYERPKLEKPPRKEVIHKRKPLDEEQLQNLAMERLNSPEIYFSRFSPSLNLQKVEIPDISYNPNTEVSFEESYINADPTTAFLLVCAVVYNSFIGESLSDFFKVPRIPGETMQSEAAKIVTTLDNDVFRVLLENKGIDDVYLPSSFARDTELIIRMQSMKKELANPGEFPSPAPFTFSHRPLQSIVFWFFDANYLHSLSKLSASTAIADLSKNLLSYFKHYLLTDKVSTILREVAVKIGPAAMLSGSWNGVRNIVATDCDDSVVVYKFWAESYKEGKLSANFIQIFQYKDILEKFYDPCSHVRCGSIASQIAGYLQAFEKFELPINFEISNENEKGILRLENLFRLVRN